MIAVYIAGPYSNRDPLEIVANVQRAMDAGDAIDDVPGLRAFVPHLSHFRHCNRPRGYEEWMSIDFDWLLKCDVVLRIPGESSGADREVAMAERSGIPVFTSVEEVVSWANTPVSIAEATASANARGEGFKADKGKPEWSLLPWSEVEDIVHVLTVGAKKYAPDNWQKVPQARARYFAAAMRHLVAWWRGERLDPETGLPHLAHAGCCVLFLAWFDRREAQ